MGKKDYTKFSNNRNDKKVEESQNGFVAAPVVEEAIIEEVVEEKSNELKPAFITNCNRLNVRSEANLESAVVCVIDASTDIMVDEESSTEEFYKVFLATGAEGFCLKLFVKLKP